MLRCRAPSSSVPTPYRRCPHAYDDHFAQNRGRVGQPPVSKAMTVLVAGRGSRPAARARRRQPLRALTWPASGCLPGPSINSCRPDRCNPASSHQPPRPRWPARRSTLEHPRKPGRASRSCLEKPRGLGNGPTVIVDRNVQRLAGSGLRRRNGSRRRGRDTICFASAAIESNQARCGGSRGVRAPTGAARQCEFLHLRCLPASDDRQRQVIRRRYCVDCRCASALS